MKIFDVIKYEGDNSTFVWKHPCEDFNTQSQLIVHESQEALFYKNGQALDLFPPGRHTLHTQNIPLLSKIINIPTDGKTPFHCEVYFINKTEQMAINWGVGNVNFLDPTANNYAFEIGASGEMSLKVSDSRKLITNLVGTEKVLDQNTLKRYFKVPITMHIKTMLPGLLQERNLSIFEVESSLTELSDIMRVRISQEMADYGVALEKFWISTIIKPKEDKFYNTLNYQRGEKKSIVQQGELDLQCADYQRRIGLIDYAGVIQKQKMDIEAQRYRQEQLGYTYQQARSFDVMEKMAANEGVGDLQNAALGLGVGFGVGGTFGNAMKGVIDETLSSAMKPPQPLKQEQQVEASVDSVPVADIPMTKQTNPASEPVSECQKSQDVDIESFKVKIQKLTLMKDAGFLTDDAFDLQKSMLLNEIMGGNN